jgi:hypothetical protein
MPVGNNQDIHKISSNSSLWRHLFSISIPLSGVFILLIIRRSFVDEPGRVEFYYWLEQLIRLGD